MTVCTAWATAEDLPDRYAGLLCESGLDDWLRVASSVLYNLTGQRWRGECDDVVRPCWQGPDCHCRRVAPEVNGPWPGAGVPGPRFWCNCAMVEEIILPNGPVREVLRVLVDGVEVDPGDYRVDDGRKLVRVDGALWPCCQHLERATTEDGTWEIWYTYGAEPPAEAVVMAAILGAELWKGQQAATDCRLPANTQTVTRQGVTITVYDPGALFPNGLTGIPEIDLWLGSLGYARKHRGVRTMVPGASQRFRRTDTGLGAGSGS